MSSRQVGIRERLLLALLFVGLTLMLVTTDWLWRWDNLIYDATLSLWSQPAPDDIVIVAIDESSLAALGRWPWSRRIHAHMVRHLSAEGAKVIAIDLIFAESDSLDENADEALGEALANSARVVLPLHLEQSRIQGQLIEQLPVPPLTESAAALGHVHVELDADGLARSIYLLAGLGDARWPALPLAMLRIGEPGRWSKLPGTRDPRSGPDSHLVWVRDHHVLIPFVGPPGRISRISYAQVLNGQHPPDIFRNKFVLVGVTAAGLGDMLPTPPKSGHSDAMPGVEFTANALHALREGQMLTTLDVRARAVLAALIALLPVFLYPRLAPRYAIVTAGALFVATLSLSIVLLAIAQVWFAPSAALLAVATSYPVWSWLRLESAMRYLRHEATQVQREQADLHVARVARFIPAMQFLSEVLPLRGWILLDASGNVRKTWGEAPTGAPPPLSAGEWLQQGAELWGAIHEFSQDWRVGAIWGGSEPPDAREQRLLTEVVESYGQPSRRRPTDSLEVVQAQIAELQEARERLQTLRQMMDDGLAQMADGVVTMNALGQVLLANRQAAVYLTGDADARLVDNPVLEALIDVEPEGDISWRQAVRRVLIERSPVRINARHRSGRDLLLQLAPLAGRPNRLGGLIINIADISEMRQRERERAEVLSFLSHDLRSPLVSVLALIELAKHEQSRDTLRGSLERMDIYTRKTLDLAEQFVELVRAETQENLRLEEIDLVAVATNALEQVWAQAKSKDITLGRRFEVDSAWIRGDSSLLERAFVNLLTNAIKYSDPGAAVDIGVSRRAQRWRIDVADTGHGIPRDELPGLFDRFKRVRRSNRDGEPGTGLGLALVKVVVERHGGSVELESEFGEGSVFRVYLPGLEASDGETG